MKVAAEFVCSAVDQPGFPNEGAPELALVGRSNVGKSSLINALVRRSLARTSAAPGKTRLVNFFRVEAEGAPAFMLVDLPGYGYARAPRSGRGGAAERRARAAEAFDAITRAYFEHRGRASCSGQPPGNNRP
ncbi:MAG: GTPase, partial [Acidobacteriota bacterium]